MDMLSKYWGQQDPDLYGGRVAGYVPDGFPILGNVTPMLTQSELESLPIVANFRAGFFRLWVPDELDAYLKIQDHAANGEFAIKARREILVRGVAGEEGDTLKIYLEWVQYEAICKPAASFDAVQSRVDHANESATVPYAHGG